MCIRDSPHTQTYTYIEGDKYVFTAFLFNLYLCIDLGLIVFLCVFHELQPEQHQQKNSLPRRNVGMQSLGKIPPTRRVPANLPSLKSEHSGNDLAVSLVPSGSTGWGSKPGETGPQPPPQPPQSTTATTPTTQSSTPVATVTAPQQQQQQQQPSVTSTASAPTTVVTSIATTSAPTIPTQSSHGDKSWSAITSSGGESVPSYFAHQSPFFHQEFPSLSGSDAGTTPCPPMTTKPDTQYATGPSLRPQSKYENEK